MRLSIIMPFLNSHELVRRQILHFKRMTLPDDVEIWFMDDGSDPPLQMPADPPKNFRIHATNDFRPWTSSIARNTGAKLARGEYLMMVDGDYIIPADAILRARAFTGDRLGLRRQFGVLDEEGRFTQDPAMLVAYGLSEERVRTKGATMPPHPNNFIIRKALFFEMGGYNEERILTRPYPHGEDNLLKTTWCRFVRDGKAVQPPDDLRPMIYMFPNGQFCAGGDVDTNPFGLFHNLSRKPQVPS